MPELNEEVIKQEALTVVQQAGIVRIIDQATYESACSLLLDQIKPFRKRWADYWESPKTAAYKAYKAILGKFQEGDDPLAKAEAQVKSEIARWDAEQEKKRIELQRQAEEEARKREQEEREREAAVAEEFGASEEEVKAIVSAPLVAVAAPVAPTFQKVSGVSTRKVWRARVTDLKKLCLAVAKGQAPTTYVTPNESALNARATSDQRTMNVPGVVAYEESIVSGRARR